ncbi:MAG: NPCBM/NEW2 domain-containing protein [Armatimonadota bacterium]
MKISLFLITAVMINAAMCHADGGQDAGYKNSAICSWAMSAFMGQESKGAKSKTTTFLDTFPVTFDIITSKIDKSKFPFMELVQQDYGKFNQCKSAVDTPLQIGPKSFTHGLGTHSISRIHVLLNKPASRFTAEIGVNTDSKRGTIVFVIESSGKEIFRSGVCRAGESPIPVAVDLNGVREIVLRVFDGGDGADSDWADWCDAKVVYADGTDQWLDSLPVYLPGSADSHITIPSTRLLPKLERTHTADTSGKSFDLHNVTYLDPDTGLKVSSEIKLYKDYRAVEWVTRLSNTGSKDTPILGAIRPLDLKALIPSDGKAVFHYNKAHGTPPTYYIYEPIDETLLAGDSVNLPGDLTTASQKFLPYFNLELPDGGICGGIGWTGQWEMDVRREGRQVRLKIGQQHTRLLLHPGESIRTPRILLMSWQGGDRMVGHNEWRRLLLDHYVPHANGQIMTPLMSQTNWFILNAGGETTEQTELAMISKMPAMGLEVYWLDAGWYGNGGDWGQEVGNWFPRKDHFPNGLRPVSDAAHKAGVKSMVWFEPERVTAISQIAKEHPEWVLPKQSVSPGGLFNLGDPKARVWMTNLLSNSISDYGVDIYRQDRNIQPLGFWRGNDAPDRQGITEIQHVEALYTMWDELLRRHPGLMIDNANWINTGPDLETMMRSIGSWTCSENYQDLTRQQLHIGSLSLYVPLQSTGVFSSDPYAIRSISRFGSLVCFDTGNSSGAQLEEMWRASDEVKMLRPLYLGEYHPLTEMDANDENWCAWQFYRPDLGEGFAMFFRRPKCLTASLDVELKGLDASARYKVDFRETYDIRETKEMSGRELSKLRVNLNTQPSSILVHYRKIGQ